MIHHRPPYPHVHQINISDGGVPKFPVLEAKITQHGLDGDRQRNLKVHGGLERAVCLFSLELIEHLLEITNCGAQYWALSLMIEMYGPTLPFWLV